MDAKQKIRKTNKKHKNVIFFIPRLSHLLSIDHLLHNIRHLVPVNTLQLFGREAHCNNVWVNVFILCQGNIHTVCYSSNNIYIIQKLFTLISIQSTPYLKSSLKISNFFLTSGEQSNLKSFAALKVQNVLRLCTQMPKDTAML